MLETAPRTPHRRTHLVFYSALSAAEFPAFSPMPSQRGNYLGRSRHARLMSELAHIR